MPRRLTLVLSFVVGAVQLAAQPALISEAETLQSPTPARIAAVRAAAQRDGWAPQVAGLRAAAVHAYGLDKLAAAEAWFRVYRWASLFGESEREFVNHWIKQVEAEQVAHANMPRSYNPGTQPLGQALSPELQGWLLGNAAFTAEFFLVLTAVDYLPNVFSILNELHQRDPAHFKTYASLALAIALVYDVPPPPGWPHGQVSPQALLRKFPAPAEAFAWWVHQDEIGRTYHRLSRLGADELKYVVDTAAPFAELEWAQKIADYPLNQLAHAYLMVRYRTDRAASGLADWPGRTYKLMDILKDGGICVDQAYFAAETGKARGVPTLIFHGAGNDARHAWFGFLDSNGKWQLDAGRYADQRFVTGFAVDPQTWRPLSDHELQFLSERFRTLPSFQQSRVQVEFAADFFAAGDYNAAALAARKAVNYERRNQSGWEILIASGRKSGRDAKSIESVIREAALAFHLYPDLEAIYVRRLAESLHARGQQSEADAEMRRIALKNRDSRTDVSIEQAREQLMRAIATQPFPEQVRAYNSAVDTFGQNAGIGFFDEIVRPFVDHLVQLHQPAEAARAIERARRTLKVEPNSQLDTELDLLANSLRAK